MSSQPVDIDNCHREPIHIPGRIQPHGVLVTFRESDLTILQASENLAAYLGFEASRAVGDSLASILPADYIEDLKSALKEIDKEEHPRYAFSMTRNPGGSPIHMEAIVHRIQGVVVLELDAAKSKGAVELPAYYRFLKNPLSALSDSSNLADLCRLAAKETRSLTGFDRVMIYRFDRDWNGSVIAEEKPPSLEPFLGLRYPASDIPIQARNLYTRNWLRIISDVGYESVPIQPILNPANGQPLDLSHSVLRSVSPMHIAYLKNMGVGASMSISIIKNGVLWGLIACHHATPRFISHEMRLACEFLGQAFSLRLSSLEVLEDERYRLGLKSLQQEFRNSMALEPDFLDGLVKHKPNLKDFADAGGAAILYDGKCRLVGNCPREAEVRELAAWLDGQATDPVYATDSLPKAYPPAEAFSAVASGLLAIAIPTTTNNYLMWFKPEVLQTVNWAGNPEKPVEIAPDGSHLSPRRSFAIWKETVLLTSLAWQKHDLEAALEIKNSLVALALKRTAEDLSASNAELDAFAYIASHDLKEPLRGIRTYSRYLATDFGEKLGEAGMGRVNTISRLAERMESLIHSLFEFSRLGKVHLSRGKVDLDKIVEDVLERLSVSIEEHKAVVTIARPLPTVECDRIRVGEIFSNLISNALKYNDKAEKRIEIGFQAGSDPASDAIPVFFVKDNGLGIPERHFDTVFKMFKRLHGRDQFGGGAGAGLAIVRKIVGTHGGRIWLESEPGHGTTFYFTLQGRATRIEA
ncbi:MAG: cph1 [Fibrobacteres bacterium]|nr:cph1 [Fibrobacterota bacterium]